MNGYLEKNEVHFDRLLVDRPFSFADAKDAYDLLECGKFHGKIIIKF